MLVANVRAQHPGAVGLGRISYTAVGAKIVTSWGGGGGGDGGSRVAVGVGGANPAHFQGHTGGRLSGRGGWIVRAGGRFTGGEFGVLNVSHDVGFRRGFRLLLGERVVILRSGIEDAHGGPTHNGGADKKGEGGEEIEQKV